MSASAARWSCLSVVAAVAWGAPAAGQTLTGLDALTPESSTFVHAISEDGRTVVGRNQFPTVSHAFLWRRGATLHDLGTLKEHKLSSAHGVSGDGTVVGGESGPETYRAFKWTPGGMMSLGSSPAGATSYGRGVSGDGSTITGWNIGAPQAFRWRDGAMIGLGFLPGGTFSQGWGINHDGSVIAGYGGTSSGDRAFRWTMETGMVVREPLVGDSWSRAYGVSADGSAVVGASGPTPPGGSRAIRWKNGVVLNLGPFLAA